MLYDKSGYDERCVRHVKEEDNVIDIEKMLTRCAKDRKILPKFVIYDPQEVPAPSELTEV